MPEAMLATLEILQQFTTRSGAGRVVSRLTLLRPDRQAPLEPDGSMGEALKWRRSGTRLVRLVPSLCRDFVLRAASRLQELLV